MNQFELDMLHCNEIKKHICTLTKKHLASTKSEQTAFYEKLILQYARYLKVWEQKLIDTYGLHMLHRVEPYM
ncbi:hypothetical protein [Bacillus thuringiensis]|uniref:hypothetical protein n=1 Tax=Bacillus thuringiensis TaxID=1428 RepID=UPI003B982D2A